MKLLKPISISCLSVSFAALPFLQSGVNIPAAESVGNHMAYLAQNNYKTTTSASIVGATILYNDLHLLDYGLSEDAFDCAYKGYQHLLEKNKINNSDYLTICDFSQPSRNKRLYIIDLKNDYLLINTYVAHGRNSGREYATRFSNNAESMKSSLGFYITENTYYGEHGLSLKVKGLEAGFNDKAVNRNIVIHGASYIDNDYLQRSHFMGRSFGCPAVPQRESKTIINTIKNGTCFFIYHPDKKYFQRSKILND